jgi:hypothetical protein
MRFKITQRMLAGSYELVWVVIDTETGEVVSKGSWTSCSNACRELNQNVPEPERLTQQKIDSDGTHRKGFYAFLTQIKQAVFPSTQTVSK